ncbi:MAG: hypothetical protein CMQ24_11950 [Gammaproteobacteria bacterium]|nr:hypothetical protein [Gammaproteobacteria bacterium]|tara:strand:- start:821 stop:2170 length:1350 start_codon:yes stop_codon:yes gene_type:complete
MNRVWTGALCLVLALIAGCDSDDGPRAVPPIAQLRIVNLIQDAPTILMDFSGNQVAGIGYAESTALAGVGSGTHLVVIATENVVDGTPEFLTQETSFAVNLNQEITIIAGGTVESPTLTRVDETRDTRLDPSNAEIHYYNAASGGAGYEVYLSADPSATSINGISPVSVAAGESSGLQVVPGGQHRLFITASGSGTIIYDSGAFNLTGSTRRMVMITDNFGPGGPVRGLLLNDSGARNFPAEQMPASIRIANLIADLGNVDVSIDGTVIWSDVDYATMSGYHEVAADNRAIEVVVTLANQPAEVLLTSNQTLVAGQFATLALAANAADGAESRLIVDSSRPIATGGRLQLVHASPEAGVLDAYLIEVGQDPATAAPRYTLPTLFIEVDTILMPRDYDLLLTFAGSLTPLAPATTLALEANRIHSVIVGDPATPGGDDFVLVVQDDSPPQ